MKKKEELPALKQKTKALNRKLEELTEDEMKEVSGGHGISVSNPLAGMSEEEAKRIAKQLGEGTYFGPWAGMSGAQFMEWWKTSNGR